MVHGAGGGFDQGLLAGADLVSHGYRVIAMSRFGYLRTPMPADASAQTQADAHACLLDELNVQRAAVLGISAGGPSALQFAIRHPQRTSALILLVPLAYDPARAPQRPPSAAMRLALRALEHDFAFWLMTKTAPALMTRTLLGTPPHLLDQASDAERARVIAIRERILPVSGRARGLEADGKVGATIGRYALESIEVPTLVVSLEDDLYSTYPAAKYTAEHIRGARFVGFPTGGHTWIGHHAEILAAVLDLLGTVDTTHGGALGRELHAIDDAPESST